MADPKQKSGKWWTIISAVLFIGGLAGFFASALAASSAQGSLWIRQAAIWLMIAGLVSFFAQFAVSLSASAPEHPKISRSAKKEDSDFPH